MFGGETVTDTVTREASNKSTAAIVLQSRVACEPRLTTPPACLRKPQAPPTRLTVLRIAHNKNVHVFVINFIDTEQFNDHTLIAAFSKLNCSLIARLRDFKVARRRRGPVEHVKPEVDKVLSREPVEYRWSIRPLLVHCYLKTNITNLEREKLWSWYIYS